MPAGLLIIPILLAQAPVVVSGRSPAADDRIDVAYSEMAGQRTEDAIRKLEADSDRDRDDPSRLINLGTAYARLGEADKARRLFATAVIASERHDIELADGTWLDSRDAARRALKLLETRRTLALR